MTEDKPKTELDSNASGSQKTARICVLGAGAAGLAMLKIIKDSDEFKKGFWSVDVFEVRDDIGGTWCVPRSSSFLHP